MTSLEAIEKECEDIKAMLLKKNASYGDSAFNPLRVFSKASSEEGLRVRIDDKLSRMARGTSFQGDNDVLDLIGYLILLRAYKRMEESPETHCNTCGREHP